MQRWMKKLFVVLIAFLTLGTYVPQFDLDASVNPEADEIAPADSRDRVTASESEDTSEADESESIVRVITEKAKAQAVAKMGPKIVKEVEEEFTSAILPAFEEVINQILIEAGEESLPYYSITEKPSAGYGEKIFNIYDERTKKNIALFHVRRDKRPQEGYWFNFHYHLSKDNFSKHHVIGEVYWDKNTPPKWMS